MKSYRVLALLLAFLSLVPLSGCAREPAPITLTEAPAPTRVATPSPALSLSPVLTPSPSPSPPPTPEDDGRIAIAEGFYYMELTDAIKERITGLSYPADDSGAAISYGDLRYIGLLYYDFEGRVREGELIVNAEVAKEVTEIFHELYLAKYPFTSIKLVDEYGEAANDDLSMEANNTSCFNYRTVAGTNKLSLHSYGAAIDINPRLNPYVKSGNVSPENGAEYADRSRDFPGKIDHDDLAYKLFAARGWTWGGDWKSVKDYQHFEKDLGY